MSNLERSDLVKLNSRLRGHKEETVFGNLLKKTMDLKTEAEKTVERREIEVVAAAIIEDNKLFATQRGYGDFKDGWEFPGGKIEKGESNEEALKRELREELQIEIEVGKLLKTIEYDYPNFHLTMHCYLASLNGAEPTLLEHEAARWVSKDDIENVDWLPADRIIVDKVKKLLK